MTPPRPVESRDNRRETIETPSPTRPVFSIGQWQWTRSDVVEFLCLEAEFENVFRSTRRASAALMGATSHGGRPTADSTSVFVERFRRTHKLLTGDETRRWLESWDLKFADLVGYAERSLAVEGLSVDRRLELDDGRCVQVSAPPTLWADIVCSGAFGLAADRLAERAAAFEPAPGGAVPNDVSDAVGRPTFTALRIARHKLRDAAMSDVALREAVERHWLEWTWIEGVRLAFRSPDAGREARLSLMSGRPLREVERYASSTLRHGFHAEDAPAAWQVTLIGSKPDDVVGPWRMGTWHEICLVVEKHEASLRRPATRQRATEWICRRAETAHAQSRVQWHAPT